MDKNICCDVLKRSNVRCKHFIFSSGGVKVSLYNLGLNGPNAQHSDDKLMYTEGQCFTNDREKSQ
jgi:hypothetical protein